LTIDVGLLLLVDLLGASDKMPINDLNHILQLQKDLWRWPRARASVMVGAGFSLNSQPLPGVTSRFPTWGQLVKLMFDELYPSEAEESADEKNYRQQQFLGENFLRLASKYEAAFGYARLDSLIRKANPDTDHVPGILHHKLLELPWNDVFTTNYDTLLDRTNVLERTYSVVAHPGELGTALSPRIVKLHGSFSAFNKLVIAEEHYRTYPKDCAPFVNTVQQSLLENSFVLVGFSGEDPNFLAWTGWIRDELQDRHSSIYLVGPLNLSSTDRLLLKRRGVTPIDLFPLFQRNEHYESILWFLESLASAAPQRPERWLDEMPEKRVISSVKLVKEVGEAIPVLPEKYALSEQGKALDVKSLIKVWRFERASYPGWIIAPESKRRSVWRSTNSWMLDIKKALPNLELIDKMVVLFELSWRLNLSMMPLEQDVVEALVPLVEEYYEIIKNNSYRFSSVVSSVGGWVAASEASNYWLNLALDLMREAREVYDEERWEKISKMVKDVLEGCHVQSDRYSYEVVLQCAWNLKSELLITSLSGWQPSSNVPLACVWKAGILAEVGEGDEAKALLVNVLRDIRESAKNKGNNIELLSLEGCCTLLISYIDLNGSSTVFGVSEYEQRWHDLKAWDCSPWELRKELERPLERPLKRIVGNGKVSKFGFDPGVVTQTWQFVGGMEDAAPAFAYIRHFEQSGLPMYLSRVNTAGAYLEKALQMVLPYVGFWSPALMLRARQIKQLTENEEFLSRVQIASMEPRLARRIHDWCIDIFKSRTDKYNRSRQQDIFQDKLVIGLPEVFSRLSFKLEPQELDQDFKLAISMYPVLSNIVAPEMVKVCHVWLNRIYDAASDEQLMLWLPELIRSPFKEGADTLVSKHSDWLDPMSDFPSSRIVRQRRKPVSAEVESSIAWLFSKIPSLSGASRNAAIWRLLVLNNSVVLSKANVVRFKDVLWAGVGKGEFPIDLHPFNYLHLPKRNEKEFFVIFKKHLLALPIESALFEKEGKYVYSSQFEFPSSRLKKIAMSSRPPVQLKTDMVGLVDWSAEEVVSLVEEVFTWWSTVKQHSTRFDAVKISGGKWFGEFLFRLVGANTPSFSYAFLKEVFDWVVELREMGIYANQALSGLYFALPEQQSEVRALLLSDLISDDEIRVRRAAQAIRALYGLASVKDISIESDLLDALVQKVVFRHDVGLHDAAQQIGFVLMQFPNVVSDDAVVLICNSLAAWARATSYSENGVVAGFVNSEKPKLQAVIATLAGALSVRLKKSKSLPKRSENVEMWRRISLDNCLPEVRRAYSDGVKYSS
jgi:hypothetical protein